MFKKNSKPGKNLQQIILVSQKEKIFSETILLLENILKKPKEFILAHPEFILSKKILSLLESKINRQKKGEPLAYILKEKEFFGIPFFVNKSTLIPRPETELLVEKILELTKEKSQKQKILLEIGTGSGCIIISLVKNITKKNWFFLANDFSKKALLVAIKNCQKNLPKEKIDFFIDDLLGRKTCQKILKLQKKSALKEIILVANLPYISQKEYDLLDLRVKNFEPQTALLSGKDGFDHYRKLLIQLKDFSQKNPILNWKIFWEIGYCQKEIAQKEIKKIFPQSQPIFSKDLAGHWRNVEFEI